MPEVEKLNVKIEADASSLKKETSESIEALERLQQKYTEVSTALSTAFSNRSSASTIAALTDQRNEIMRLINSLKAGTIGPNDLAISKALGDIDTTGIEKAQDEVKELDTELKEVKNTQNQINVGWDTSGIKNLTRNIKKVVMSVIGIRSVFSLISKSMHTYLSQNDALRQKLDGIYYAIGSMFAPILEWIVNLFAKIVLYVNAFLKGLGLAGIQFKNIQSNAQKTQKTMRTLISGFDELNTLQKQNTDDSANSLTDPFADVKVNTEWIEKLTKLGEKLRPVFEWLRNTLKNIFDWVLDHIELVLGALLAIKAIKFIINVAEALGGLKAVWDILKSIGSAIATFITSPLGGAILMFAGWSAAAISFFEMWKNGWSLSGEIIKDIGIALAAIGAVIMGAPATVAAAVAGIVAVLSSLVIVIHDHWDEIVAWTKKLIENIKALWEKCKQYTVEGWNKICTAVSEITQNVSNVLKEKWEIIKNNCKIAWENTKQIGHTIWTNMKEDFSFITTTTGQLIRDKWNNTKTVLSDTWNNIKSTANTVWNNIKTAVVNANQVIGTQVSNIWNGLKTTIKNSINGIIGFINGMIRGVTGGINAVINLLNNFSVDIPDWVPGVGGAHFGFHLRTLTAPQIPTLGSGGVLDRPTLAWLGEYANAGNNPEIAAPQSLFQSMLDENNANLIASFAQMTSQIISAIEGVDMEVNIGDETIARSAARGNNSYKSMTGKSLITV